MPGSSLLQNQRACLFRRLEVKLSQCLYAALIGRSCPGPVTQGNICGDHLAVGSLWHVRALDTALGPFQEFLPAFFGRQHVQQLFHTGFEKDL